MATLLSIVIPSNNKTELLDKAISSIVRDESWCSKFELCISDNSNNSSTYNLVREKWVNRSDITYRRSLDAPSLDENVNKAVNMCSGEYAWIFGDDDILSPGFLGYLLEHLAKNNPEIIIINSSSFDHNGEIEASRHCMKNSRTYGPDDNDVFLSDMGAYITYVPSIIIKKNLWIKFFQTDKYGTFFAHIDAVCRAKIGQTAHYLAKPGIKMRLHSQTWTAKHFEIWNIFFPKVIWDLEGYSTQAKNQVTFKYPLKSVSRLISSRAYGKFDLNVFREILLNNRDYSFKTKFLGCIISFIPKGIFRLLYILFIKLFKNKHDMNFSPELALAQLRKKRN